MHRSARRWLRMRSLAAAGTLAMLAASLPAATTAQQVPPPRTLIPIGASYQPATLAMFAERAVARNTDGVVEIRVILATYPTDADTITPNERAQNLSDAQVRANQLQNACAARVPSGTTCNTTIPDIQVRADALNPAKTSLVGPETDGIYILGGDQTIAMKILANTPIETRMIELYRAGVPIAGNSAGSAVQSRYMIGGYTEDAFAWDGLQQGALDLWYGATDTFTRGLNLGLNTAVIDQHVVERGRIGRLLQAAHQLPGEHQIGIGTDWGTGALIENERIITGTQGAYVGIVLDEDTYGAAEQAIYAGTNRSLSIANVALHVLAPDALGYDLATRQTIANGQYEGAPALGGRTFGMLSAPGTLMLGGDLTDVPTGTVVVRFATLARQQTKPTLVLAGAYGSDTAAAEAANTWRGHLLSLGITTVQTATITASTSPALLAAKVEAAGAVFFTAQDQVELAGRLPALNSAGLPAYLRTKLQAGVPMLFDNAAAAAAGTWMSANPSPVDLDETEIAASDSFITGTVAISAGLGLIPNAVFEPRALYDYRYGRLVSHVLAHPDSVAFGIERETAIELTATSAVVRGPRAVIAIDGRRARTRTTGSNDALAASWLLLDTRTTDEPLTTRAARYSLRIPVVLR